MDDRVEHLNLALRSIREVHRLLLRMKDRPQLLRAICDALVNNRGYYNAWIVLLDDSNRVLETAEAGLGDAFGPMLDRLNGGQFTACARRALDQTAVVVIDDPYDACADCPLSDQYSGRSAMTVRLEHEGNVFGLLCVSIPRPFTDNNEELELLKEIAGDIAYGLRKFALEQALEKNRQRFRDVVESSPTGILIVQNGVVVYRNPEQARISGPYHEVGSTLEFTNVDPDDAEKVREFRERIASGARPATDTDFRFYVSGRTHDRADMKWVYCRASAIEYRGNPAVLINMIDITRSKELEHLVLVKDKMASLGHIAAGIAHEIRNPLSGINIYLNTLENCLGESEQPEMTRQILNQIQSASRKIESIIKRVIDFSRPSEPKLDLADIKKPIEEAIQLSSVTMRKQRVKIVSALADDLPQCYIDPTLIEEVLLNLMTNAAEAMRNQEGDRLIEVASGMQNGLVYVRVSDSGPGIPAQLRTKVLEPFYTTKKSGSGIGLSLCHRIITDHGGHLEVGSSRWSGAEFVIKLPVGRRE